MIRDEEQNMDYGFTPQPLENLAEAITKSGKNSLRITVQPEFAWPCRAYASVAHHFPCTSQRCFVNRFRPHVPETSLSAQVHGYRTTEIDG